VSSGDRGRTPPGRIQWEIDRFADVDLPVAAGVENELWVLRFERRYQGDEHEFRVVFPVDHPEMPAIVFGPPRLLVRHQNPESGSLCLVDNEHNWWRPWRPATDLVAQLDSLLRASEHGLGTVVAGEAPIAEPITGHLSYREDRTILVPDALLVDDIGAAEGTFRLRRIDEKLHVVAALFDSGGARLAGAEPEVVGLTRDDGAIGGWIELTEPPTAQNLTDALKSASTVALANRNARRGGSNTTRRRRRQQQTRATGVTFFEEGPTQGERRRTWVFAETEAPNTEGVSWVSDRPIRAQAISDRQRHDRIPELKGLGDTRIVMVGAGSLGSEVAVELAKAGAGRLDIFDGDVYEPGNSVRHVLPVTAAGRPKAHALQELCRDLNPFCDTRGYANDLGQPTGDPEETHQIIERADLIIETTGSHSITRMLRRRAGVVGIPVVTAALSIGGYGGRAVVLRSGGPCWDCFLLAQDAGSIPIPDEGPRHDTTPFGCSHPAASCAGFDVAHLAAVTARMSVQALLCVPYPDSDHDWTVLNFRPGSNPVRQGNLAPDPSCPLPVH
jgi:molybdopterin/thiamine biosynthesis adenylyltransferase